MAGKQFSVNPKIFIRIFQRLVFMQKILLFVNSELFISESTYAISEKEKLQMRGLTIILKWKSSQVNEGNAKNLPTIFRVSPSLSGVATPTG